MASRIDNYTAGVNPARITAILTSSKSGMVGGFTTWIGKMANVYQRLLAVLSVSATVKTVEIAHYYAFCNEMASLLSRIPGGTPLQTEATNLATKWASLGLDHSTLLTVDKVCFGMVVT
jgi:hypothetical protein